MSKAFTRESDDLPPDEIAPQRVPSGAGEKAFMTREGADRLRHELNVLLEKKHSLSGGDGASDADARAELRRVESAIQRLQSTLDSVVIADRPADLEKVGFGASVLVRDASGEEEGYQIVGLAEAEPGEGRISSASPLARALMNRRAGDRVRFETPAGDRELAIIRVVY